jgi:hypothetical protein
LNRRKEATAASSAPAQEGEGRGQRRPPPQPWPACWPRSWLASKPQPRPPPAGRLTMQWRISSRVTPAFAGLAAGWRYWWPAAAAGRPFRGETR